MLGGFVITDELMWFVAASDSEVYACTVNVFSPGLWLDEWLRPIHEDCVKWGKKIVNCQNKLWITNAWNDHMWIKVNLLEIVTPSLGYLDRGRFMGV